MRIKLLARLLGESANSWLEHRAPRLAAALAYYSLISLTPLLIISFRGFSLVLGAQASQDHFVEGARLFLGQDNARVVAEVLSQAGSENSAGGTLALGLGVLVLAATAVMTELQAAMNTVWGITVRPGWAWWFFVRRRLMSFVMLLGPALLLLALILISQLLEMAYHQFHHLLPHYLQPWVWLHFLAALPLLLISLVLLYKILPDAHVPWRAALAGAAVATVLLTIGREGLNFYLSRSRIGTAFGAARSVLLFLVWVYYSGMMFFYGAEVARAWAMRYPDRVRLERHAAWTEPKK